MIWIHNQVTLFGFLRLGYQIIYRVVKHGNWLSQVLLKKVSGKLNFEVFEQSELKEIW